MSRREHATMNNRRLEHVVLFAGVMILLVVGAVGLQMRTRQRQEALNRKLMDALVNYDFQQALVLVNAGANPNTRLKIAPPPKPPSIIEIPTSPLLSSGQPGTYRPSELFPAASAEFPCKPDRKDQTGSAAPVPTPRPALT